MRQEHSLVDDSLPPELEAENPFLRHVRAFGRPLDQQHAE
jgi:hypothetical protein